MATALASWPATPIGRDLAAPGPARSFKFAPLRLISRPVSVESLDTRHRLAEG